MMNKTLLFLAIIGTFLFTSCSEKVDLIGNFQETAVVYGLMDQADTLHYIKITRAFIGPGNAVEIAQIDDSSYFNQVDATVTEVLNGAVTRSWQLRDTLVDNKDTIGSFYAPFQKVYYFKTLPTSATEAQQISPNPSLTSLHKDAIYRLNISINGGQFEVSGETALVKGLTSTATSQNYMFKFANNPAEYISTGVTASNTGSSFVLNAQLDVEFNEYIGMNKTSKSFNWNIGEINVTPNSSKTFTALGQTFYNLMKSNVTNDPSITRRTFKGIRITFTGGSEELYNYMVVNSPSSSLAQTKPSYTNLSVTNNKKVVGIFSSRQTFSVFKPFFTSAQQAYIRAIDKKSTKELCTGPITGLLLFCSDHPGDNVIGQEEAFSCP